MWNNYKLQFFIRIIFFTSANAFIKEQCKGCSENDLSPNSFETSFDKVNEGSRSKDLPDFTLYNEQVRNIPNDFSEEKSYESQFPEGYEDTIGKGVGRKRRSPYGRSGSDGAKTGTDSGSSSSNTANKAGRDSTDTANKSGRDATDTAKSSSDDATSRGKKARDEDADEEESSKRARLGFALFRIGARKGDDIDLKDLKRGDD